MGNARHMLQIVPAGLGPTIWIGDDSIAKGWTFERFLVSKFATGNWTE